jgi:hypothetical protein
MKGACVHADAPSRQNTRLQQRCGDNKLDKLAHKHDR